MLGPQRRHETIVLPQAASLGPTWPIETGGSWPKVLPETSAARVARTRPAGLAPEFFETISVSIADGLIGLFGERVSAV